MSEQGLRVSHVDHSYDSKQVLHDVCFDVAQGKVVALLGPSGCGKSTILRAIAGLIQPSRGSIQLKGRELMQLPVRNRGLGMVFQNFALFSHLTVAENVAYGLAHLPKAQRAEKVAQMLSLVHLTAFADRFPSSLSGGQQQRVAVARALATSPAALLMDEPFGALDRALRSELQSELVRMQENVGITTIMVTHDQEEAQAVAEQLVIMKDGRVEQVGSPEEIYDNPASLFVNSFIGHANQIEANVVNSQALNLIDGLALTSIKPLNYLPNSSVTLTFRPEHVALSLKPQPNALKARFRRAVIMGPHLVADAVLNCGREIKIQLARDDATRPAKGDEVWLTPDPARLLVFPSTPA